MANITYRVNSNPAIPGISIVKGAPLTNVEVDANFRAIDIEVDQLNSSTVRLTGDQTIGGVKRFADPVGIGVSPAPGVSFHVQGSISRIQGNSCSLGFSSPAAVNNWYVGANISDTVNDGFHIGQGTGIGGTLRMRIDPGGNVTATGNITAGGQFIGNVTGNAATVTNGVYTTGDQTIGGTKTFTGMIRLSGDPAAVGTAGPTGILEVGDPSGNTPATMSFHKQGFAINMGLDADNVFRLGGWSQGLNVHRWTSDTSGNFTALGNITAGGSINAASYNGGQLAGMRNKIINGKMEIAQRGTSFAAPASGTYSLDRWRVDYTTSIATISQQADVPSSNEFQSSLRFEVTTAGAIIAAGDFALIEHRVEGFNVRDLVSRAFTLSFWVRSSKTGIHCVAFRNAVANNSGDRSFIAEYTINAVNTWEFKTVTIGGGLITAGANWNWTTGSGLNVGWVLAAGSTLQTTAGAWQTGNFIATANQVNCLDTIGNIFAITGVQLEPGSVATPFEHRPYGAELALCQRYYEEVWCQWGTATTASMLHFSARYMVMKRAVPSLTVYADTAPHAKTGAVGNVRNTTTSSNISATPGGPLSQDSFALTYTAPASATNMSATVVASIEL